MLFKHILAHLTYNCSSQTEIYVRVGWYRMTSPPAPVFRANPVNDRKCFPQWSTQWTVSLKALHQTRTQTGLLYPSVCVYTSLVWKAREQLPVFPNMISAQSISIIKQSCQDPQPLLKNTTCQKECSSFVLNAYLCSTLVFVHFSKTKSLLLPEIKVCPCLHCAILFQLHFFNLTSFRGCKI